MHACMQFHGYVRGTVAKIPRSRHLFYFEDYDRIFLAVTNGAPLITIIFLSSTFELLYFAFLISDHCLSTISNLNLIYIQAQVELYEINLYKQ